MISKAQAFLPSMKMSATHFPQDLPITKKAQSSMIWQSRFLVATESMFLENGLPPKQDDGILPYISNKAVSSRSYPSRPINYPNINVSNCCQHVKCFTQKSPLYLLISLLDLLWSRNAENCVKTYLSLFICSPHSGSQKYTVTIIS